GTECQIARAAALASGANPGRDASARNGQDNPADMQCREIGGQSNCQSKASENCGHVAALQRTCFQFAELVPTSQSQHSYRGGGRSLRWMVQLRSIVRTTRRRG